METRLSMPVVQNLLGTLVFFKYAHNARNAQMHILYIELYTAIPYIYILIDR